MNKFIVLAILAVLFAFAAAASTENALDTLADEIAEQLLADAEDDLNKKAEEALVEIFKHEGQCQNWSSDSGNKFQGKIGYTCKGTYRLDTWESA